MERATCLFIFGLCCFNFSICICKMRLRRKCHIEVRASVPTNFVRVHFEEQLVVESQNIQHRQVPLLILDDHRLELTIKCHFHENGVSFILAAINRTNIRIEWERIRFVDRSEIRHRDRAEAIFESESFITFFDVIIHHVQHDHLRNQNTHKFRSQVAISCDAVAVKIFGSRKRELHQLGCVCRDSHVSTFRQIVLRLFNLCDLISSVLNRIRRKEGFLHRAKGALKGHSNLL